MSRRFMVRAVLAAAGVAVMVLPGAASAQETTRIDASVLDASGCFGQAACEVEGVQLSVSGGTIARKVATGATGFGVSGGAAGSEIDIGETLSVDVGDARNITEIKFLFLYNGPEFGDKAEKARVIADGTAYTLSVATTRTTRLPAGALPEPPLRSAAPRPRGTGCFVVTDPFPAAVSSSTSPQFPAPRRSRALARTIRTTRWDTSMSRRVALDWTCSIARAPAAAWSTEGFDVNSMQVATPAIDDGARDRGRAAGLPLHSAGLPRPAAAGRRHAATDNAAREILIGLGVIKPLVPRPQPLHPARSS